MNPRTLLPTSGRRRPGAVPAAIVMRSRTLILALSLVLPAGLLPALDPLLAGVPTAHADAAPAATSAVRSANSTPTVPQPQGTPLPISDPVYMSLNDPSVSVQGGWRDGTRLVPVTGATAGELDPLKLYLVTDASAMVSIPALTAANCPGSLSVGAEVRAVCAASAASNVRADFPTGATALLVKDPGPTTPFDGVASGNVQVAATSNVASSAVGVTSMALGFYQGRTVLLMHKTGHRWPIGSPLGDEADPSWTAYAPLDASGAAVVDLVRRQLRGQDAPVGMLGESAPTPVSNRGASLYRLSASASNVTAEKVTRESCIDPCYAVTSGTTLLGYVGVTADLVQVYRADGTARGQIFGDAVMLGYPTATAAPATGWEPYVVFQPFGTRIGVPLSSALGQELNTALWGPTNGSWSYGIGFTRAQRLAMLHDAAPPSSVAGRETVSTAEFTYRTTTLHEPADRFVVKDSYTADDLKNWIPVDTSDRGSVIADGERHYIVTSNDYSPVNFNPSSAATVSGAGMGVRKVGSSYVPTLVVQDRAGYVFLLDLNTADANTVLTFGLASGGRLSRSRLITPPNDTPVVTTPLNTRTTTTFVGSWPADQLVRSLAWSDAGVAGQQVVRTGFGCYQQVDAAGAPVGGCVKAVAVQLADDRVWLLTPNPDDAHQTAALKASLSPTRSETPQANSTDFSGYSWGQAADFLSQRGVGDTVATYEVATQAGALPPDQQKMARALLAKSILQDGQRFPFHNGGRNVLTPTEAAELFDAAKTDTAIRESLQNPAVLKDITETTKDVAALADADEALFPLQTVNISDPDVAAVTSLHSSTSSSASSLEQRMALRAATWILDEFRARSAQPLVTGFGDTTETIKSRLASYYPDAANDVLNQALINAFVLLHIDNETILAAFRANPRSDVAWRKANIRYFLDPKSTGARFGCATPAGLDQEQMEWRTRYDGLWQYLLACKGGTSAYEMPDATTITNDARKRQFAWQLAQQGARVLSLHTAGGRPARLAQQILAVDAAGFALWAGGGSAWSSVKAAVNQEGTDLMALLTKLDPVLAATVAAALATNGTADLFGSVTAAGLTRDELAGIVSDALRKWLTFVRLVVRSIGLASDTVLLISQALERAKVAELAYRFADIWLEYGKDLRVSDVGTLEKLLEQRAPIELPGVVALNRLGAIGGVAGLAALGILAYRFRPGHPPTSWTDRMAIADAVFAAASTASHQVRFGATMLFFWGEQWNSVLTKANNSLGIGETPRHLMQLLSDENEYQNRVLTARIVVARAAGQLKDVTAFKSLIESNHFTVSDDDAERFFTRFIATVSESDAGSIDKYRLSRADLSLLDADDARAAVTTSGRSRSSYEASRVGQEETWDEWRKKTGLDADRANFSESAGAVLEDRKPADSGQRVKLGKAVEDTVKARRPAEPARVFGEISNDPRVWVEVEWASESDELTTSSLRTELQGSPADPAASERASAHSDGVAKLESGLKDYINQGRIRLNRIGVMFGLGVLYLMALCDVVGGAFLTILSAWSIAHAATTEDRIVGALDVVAGVAILVAGILEFVGTALATVILLPLFVVGLLLILVALLINLLAKKHPEQDNDALTDWITPYDDAGLLKYGAVSRADLLQWHSHSPGMDRPLHVCSAGANGTPQCDTSDRHRTLYRLKNVGTRQCLGLANQPYAPGHPAGHKGTMTFKPEMVPCDAAAARNTDNRLDASQPTPPFAWELVQPYDSDTSVLWALLTYTPQRYDQPAAASAHCLAATSVSGTMTCPHDYTSGDGGASQPGQWDVEWVDDNHTVFRLRPPGGTVYLTATDLGQAPAKRGPVDERNHDITWRQKWTLVP